MLKLVTKILSLLALFALGTVCTYFYLIQSGFGIFNLLTPGVNSSLESYGFDEFMVGDKATGHFTSAHNNLGIVAVRFTNKNRDSRDVVIFRIKEDGSGTWYYEAKYNTDQFLPGKLFPFGFPQVENSKDKNFIYEIESTNGATGSGIFLDYQKPVYVSAYFFNKNDVMGDLKSTISFILQKSKNIFENKTDLIQVIIFFIPAVFITIYLFFGNKKTPALYLLFFTGIIFDIFLVPNNSTFLMISLTFIWMFAKLKYRTNSIFTIYNILILLLFSLTAALLRYVSYAEKTTVWVYILFFYLFFEQLQEIKIGFKSSIDLNFLKQVSIGLAQKNRIKINKIIPVLITGSCIFIAYLLIESIILVKNSFKIYTEYFSDGIPSVILSQFIFGITIIFISYSLLFMFFIKIKIAKIIPILISTVLLFQITKIFVSNSTSFQYVPKIISLTPQKTTEAWVDVTVNGLNFEDKPFVGKLFLSGEEQFENIINWSNKSIIFRTNPSKTKSGNVCVQTLSRGESNCLPFEYNFSKK